MKKDLKLLVLSAVIAAAYAALTYASALLGLAYGPVQFRLSEALCVLPAFTPAAIPGLALGCLISNIGSTLGPVDMVCGTAATLLAALVGYCFRKVRPLGIAWPSMVACILSNAVIVGAELTVVFSASEAFWPSFAMNALFVGLGETAVCVLAGIPFSILLEKNKTVKKLLG